MKVDLTDVKYIENLRRELRVKFAKPDDDVMIFLEDMCNFAKPLNIYNKSELIYHNAQRDLLLTIKTLLDYKLTDKEVAMYYKKLQEE